MTDPRDPHAAERRAEREQAYRDAMLEQDLDRDTHLRAAKVADCPLCDDDGYRNNRVCDHIDRTAIAKRGIAKCREALTAKQLRLDEADR